MSFFAPNWAGALSLLFTYDSGPEDLWSTGPLSATISSITAWTSSVPKKDIHIPRDSVVMELKQ
jgi:hypothetical protein